MTHRRGTRLLLALLALVLLGAAACNGDDDGPDAGPTTPFAPGGDEEAETADPFDVPPITGASRFRDSLLRAAEQDAGAERGADRTFGVLDAWTRAYPAVDFAELATPDEQTVSFYANTIDSVAPASLENPHVVVFVVRARNQGCAGGIASGFPTLTAFDHVDMADLECDALAAAERWADMHGFAFSGPD